MALKEITQNKIWLSYGVIYECLETSRAPGIHLDSHTLKNDPSGHPNMFVINFLKCQFNPSNAKATSIQSTRTQQFLKTI